MRAVLRPALLSLLLLTACDAGEPIAENASHHTVEVSPAIPPMKAIPTETQLAWQEGELYLFVHFGVNTFTGVDWGTGQEDPDVFQPSAFDPDQWAQVARETGFKGIVFTAKHHDGFALWPTLTTSHSIAASSWRDGGADVVQEVADATRAAGLLFGLYLSPWDKNAPSYGTPAYDDLYVAQLEELLTGYGPIFEVWMDGAHGEGVNPNYDLSRYHQTIRALQPEALIAISGPDIRWAGNEVGVAPETAWSPVEDSDWWYPYECDVPNRPHWFWRAEEDDQVKTLQEHLELYFTCVGRNGVLLLNVPPNTEGRIPDADVEQLRAFRQALDDLFSDDYALHAGVTSSSVRGDDIGFAAANAVDGKEATFWAVDDSLRSGWLEFDLGSPRSFNTVELREPIQYGQRVASYRVEAEVSGAWVVVTRGTTIGHKRLNRFPTVQSRRLRLVIEDARGAPAIEAFGIYDNPYGD